MSGRDMQCMVLKHLLNSPSCLVTSVQVPLKEHNVFQ